MIRPLHACTYGAALTTVHLHWAILAGHTLRIQQFNVSELSFDMPFEIASIVMPLCPCAGHGKFWGEYKKKKNETVDK